MAAFTLLRVIALLAGAGCARVAWAEGPPLDLHNEKAVAALQVSLSNPDFQIRQDAQHLLEKLAADKIPDLARLADAATDPEVKGRLLAAIDAIEERAAVDPPLLSINVQNATLEEVAAALTRSTGVNFAVRSPGNPNVRFTLALADQSFWELHRQLTAIHPIWFANPTLAAPGIQVQLDPVNWRQSTISHGFGVFIENLRAAAPAPAGGVRAASVPPFNTIMGIGIDPRVHLIEVGVPDFALAVDELGNRWALSTSSAKTTTTHGATMSISRAIGVAPPSIHGKMLATVAGSISAIVSLEEAQEKIENIGAQLNVPILLGNSQVTLTTFDVNNRMLRLGVSIKPRPGKEQLLTSHPELSRISADLLDPAGAKVRTLVFSNGTTTVTTSALGAGPFTLVLTGTVRAKEIRIPFEFKNLPLPE